MALFCERAGVNESWEREYRKTEFAEIKAKSRLPFNQGFFACFRRDMWVRSELFHDAPVIHNGFDRPLASTCT
jgi:hypothetical protein